jgi:CheY-like chemotaxis protein
MQPSSEKKAIIIVEDNEPVAELIRETLNAEPWYSAVAVHDGSEALEVIHSLQASAIVLDVGLPGLNGLQIYDALRADPATRDVPVIFVTGHFIPHEFSARGIMNVLPKPFNLDDLLAKVGMVCGTTPQPQPDAPPTDEPAPDPMLVSRDDDIILDARHYDLADITYFLSEPG